MPDHSPGARELYLVCFQDSSYLLFFSIFLQIALDLLDGPTISVIDELATIFLLVSNYISMLYELVQLEISRVIDLWNITARSHDTLISNLLKTVVNSCYRYDDNYCTVCDFPINFMNDNRGVKIIQTIRNNNTSRCIR